MSPKTRKNTSKNGNANAKMNKLMSNVRCWAVSSQIYFSGIAWSLCVRWSSGMGQDTSIEKSNGSVGKTNPNHAGSLGSKLKKHKWYWFSQNCDELELKICTKADNWIH